MSWAKSAANSIRNPFKKNGKWSLIRLGGAGVIVGLAIMAVLRHPFSAGGPPEAAAAVGAPDLTDMPAPPVDIPAAMPVTEKAAALPADASKPAETAAVKREAGPKAGDFAGHANAASNSLTPAASEGASLLEAARREEDNAGGAIPALERARDLYQQALESGRLDTAADAQCLGRLTELSNKLLFDARTACTKPKAVFHTVGPGDVVEKLAKKYHVNQGQLKVINRLSSKLTIRHGQVLKMLPGEVVYKVDRAHLTGTLYIDGVFARRYPVGIGGGNATTPGTYPIETKVVNPDWYFGGKKIPFGDPTNILGTRWLGFAPGPAGQGAGLGVHGTSAPETVPGRESKGCIRMHNADVEEMYDLMPLGGKVVIAE